MCSCASSLVPSVLHLSHSFQCSSTLNRQPYEGRLPLTSWWRKSSNTTVGQSSLISLTHHCYEDIQEAAVAGLATSWHQKSACLGGAVDSVTVRAAWLRWSACLGSRPRLARSLCQVIAVYALRLNSRAGTEGSTVSSLICDRWPILGSETLSISRCLNHW